MADVGDVHVRHIYEGEPDEDLIEALEPDQLVEVMDSEVPPAVLSPAARAGLALLRVWVVLLAAMVLVVFAAGIWQFHH